MSEFQPFAFQSVPVRTLTPENFDQASIALFAEVVAFQFSNAIQLENFNE